MRQTVSAAEATSAKRRTTGFDPAHTVKPRPSEPECSGKQTVTTAHIHPKDKRWDQQKEL